MDHNRRALAAILTTLIMTLGVHGAAQATLIPTLDSLTPSGGDLGDFGAQASISLMDAGRNQGPEIGSEVDSVGNVAVPAPVPEPATLILLGSTMAGLGMTLRRRWRRKTGV